MRDALGTVAIGIQRICRAPITFILGSYNVATFNGIHGLRIQLTQGLLIKRKLATDLLLFHGRGGKIVENCLA
jgi:hypothetical protein